MTDFVVRLETSTDDLKPRSPMSIRWLDNRLLSTIRLTQSSELNPLGVHTEAAEDLLAIAITAYCADRSIVRMDQADGWTRYITIEVPVRDPDRWDKDLLQKTLSFLTGDHWRIELRRGQPNPGLRTTDRALIPADSVALFSGGVDSLAGVCDAIQLGESVALASHFGDSSSSGVQNQLAAELGGDRLHCQFRLQSMNIGGSNGWPGFIDSTMRSRSFLFLALGLLVARCQDADRLRMSENGYIAVNVPLHEGRIGSLSTRTAHPQFVDSLNQILATSDLGAKIDNPYLLMTKGEVAKRLMDLAPSLAWRTISCAHPTAGRWQHRTFRNCGYCYPCIIRQAGFHHAGGDQTVYSADPFTDIRFHARSGPSSDARSVARFLVEPLELGDVLATGRIGSFELAEKLHEMCLRGFGELDSLFEQRATRRVKRELGL